MTGLRSLIPMLLGFLVALAPAPAAHGEDGAAAANTAAANTAAANTDEGSAQGLRAIDILNGSNHIAFVRSAGRAETQLLPGDSQVIKDIVDSTVVIETRAQPSAVPSRIEVQARPQDPYNKAAPTTGQIVVENAWSDRLEIYIDNKWVSTLATGSSFVQNLLPGRYAMTIADPATKAALIERELQVRLDKTLKWSVGKGDGGQEGYLSVRNLSDRSIFLFVNGKDRGTLGSGAERTFFGIQAINDEATAVKPPTQGAPAASEAGGTKPAVTTGNLWGQNPTGAQGAPPPSDDRKILPAEGNTETAPLQGMDEASLKKGMAQSASKQKVGTLQIGNQTDRVMTFYVNGEHVGDLAPGQELKLGEQALGEYLITAEDKTMGAFVRGRVSVIQPGQIVVWNAKGWF